MAGGRSGSLDSQVAKEVAIACLLTPDQPHGVRPIARYIDRAPSAVSSAMAGLRDDGLLTSAGEAMVPDLFHELLLTVWRRRAVLLATLPDTGAREAGAAGARPRRARRLDRLGAYRHPSRSILGHTDRRMPATTRQTSTFPPNQSFAPHACTWAKQPIPRPELAPWQ